MTINNLKELEKLIKMCRRTGVSAIKVDGIEFALGQDPQDRLVKPAIDTEAFPEATISVPTPNIRDFPKSIEAAIGSTGATNEKIDMPDELTEEQLLYYSARPEPTTA